MKTFLKLILAFTLLGSLAAIPTVSKAQIISRKAKDSVVDGTTKYITYNSVVTGTQGWTLTGIKSTGTPSGYAILQVRTDTIPTVLTAAWEDYVSAYGRRDTLFFTNVSTPQSHSFQAPYPLHINGARFKIVTSGTQKVYLYALHVQR
jgi:hypothetical protein